MANPIPFTPRVDPKLELRKQLDAAPLENAEALLVAYDILKTAHANGTLDLIDGLVGGRDIIAAKLAEYAKLPGGVAAIRNLLAAGKILMALDPETLDNLSKCIVTATGEHRAETRAPSLWQLAKRATSEDGRRGLSFLTLLSGRCGPFAARHAHYEGQIAMDDDPHGLRRFVEAQEPVYPQVRAELTAARKRSHWMWFIFPQIQGLGTSPTAKHFAIRSLPEAIAYLEHPVLGPRLEECTALVNAASDKEIAQILGYPDDLKFRSSMTLFVAAERAAGNSESTGFDEALSLFFDGVPDAATLERL